MPLFEYCCRACDSQVELLVRANETPVCPECHSEDLEKLLSGFSVGKSEGKKAAHSGCGCADDCIGNQAAAARARGKASCC